MNNKIKIVFTDLDGTLLNSNRLVSGANLNILEELGRRNIVRVIATGRSFYSYNKAIETGFPADYLIFSTGAGILDLNTGNLLISSNLEKKDITYISAYLIEHQAEFMVHHGVPQNHRFTYFGDTKVESDFTRRLRIYQAYAREYNSPSCLPEESAQVIAIFPEDLLRFNLVKKGLNGFQVTRTTSPLDGRSIWMEIFPPHVSKGQSAEWLCKHLEINQQESLGIGNDYNDISLLEYTNKSYVVANAPLEMQREYCLTLSNDEDGFYQAINNAIQQN